MSAVWAALLGALIGAIAGLAGAGVAGVASIRSSQLAARAPLASKLHAVSQAAIRLSGARGQPDENEKKRDFEIAWNDLALHQRILCPSARISTLLYMIRRAVLERGIPLEIGLKIAGQSMERAALMVSAHSTYLFRWRAERDESRILRRWVDSEDAQMISEDFRNKLLALADDPTLMDRLPTKEA